VDEIDASVVACDVDIAVNISFEATCKWREKGEGVRQCFGEMRDESLRR